MQGSSTLKAKATFLIGLVIVIGYWLWVHPPGFGSNGYSEDFCIDLSRQLIAEGIKSQGRPAFVSNSFMTPFGTPMAFMSWSIERDWLGAYFWLWNKNFPFTYFYFCISLLGTYLGIGAIMRKMGGRLRDSAWLLAALFTVFNIPRHFKIYHHYEHLIQHWAYWAIFLDAWIWHRLWTQKKWSIKLEVWRALCLLGTLGIGGYYWGPMIWEWGVLRLGILWFISLQKKRGRTQVQIEFESKKLILPFLISLVLGIIDLTWFLPLVKEVRALGNIWQMVAWHADLKRVFEPLWLTKFFSNFSAIDSSETVVTIGWLYWIPIFIGLFLIRKKRHTPPLDGELAAQGENREAGEGWGRVLPHLVFFAMILLYIRHGWPFFYSGLVRQTIPFMSFFRVASRMGLFFSMVAGALIALLWDPLCEWYLFQWRSKNRVFRLSLALFLGLSCVELSWLAYPVNAMPEIDPSLSGLLSDLKNAPGDSVLDLPFCVAGGNGVCSQEQCPQYGDSTVQQCLRAWHEKKIYGVYLARLVEPQCDIYRKPPYQSWFQAWQKNRCFTAPEWGAFCSYLDSHTELSGVLVYPDIWSAAGESSCQQQFEAHLGLPIESARFMLKATRGGQGAKPTRLQWFKPKCGVSK